MWRLWTTYTANKKAHGVPVSISLFLAQYNFGNCPDFHILRKAKRLIDILNYMSYYVYLFITLISKITEYLQNYYATKLHIFFEITTSFGEIFLPLYFQLPHSRFSTMRFSIKSAILTGQNYGSFGSKVWHF